VLLSRGRGSELSDEQVGSALEVNPTTVTNKGADIPRVRHIAAVLECRGFMRSRTEAVAICQRMMTSSLIESVDNEDDPGATFTDNYTFYRFVWDKVSSRSAWLREIRGTLDLL
jgi:hypothetical protein